MAPVEHEKVVTKTTEELETALRLGQHPVVRVDEVGLQGISMYSKAVDRLVEKVLPSLQNHLLELEGHEFEDGESMREWVKHTMVLLDRLSGGSLKFVVPGDGKHAGKMGRLIVVCHEDYGERFAIRFVDGLARLHANGMRIPRLDLVACNSGTQFS